MKVSRPPVATNPFYKWLKCPCIQLGRNKGGQLQKLIPPVTVIHNYYYLQRNLLEHSSNERKVNQQIKSHMSANRFYEHMI